jgi:hypothetical protein
MQTSYPLAERDPNISGRTSRASNLSVGSKGAGYHSGNIYRKHHTVSGKSDLLSTAPGVMGMLRTTMEIGDVASLAISNKKFGKPIQYNGPNRRSGAVSRQSTGSASSQPMGRTSCHQIWPSISSAGRRRSITSNITAPSFLDHRHPGNFSNRPESPPVTLDSHSYSVSRDGGRSLSLTNALSPSHGLSHNQSLTSLRSRMEPYRRPPSPGYRYPTRLKRPGFRPSSPALSDLTGVPPSKFGHQGGSRLKPGYGYGHGHLIAPVARHPAPYPALRNRSAPTVTTLSSNGSNQALRGNGQIVRPRDDTSLSDQSMHQSFHQHPHQPKKSISYKPSRSIRTHSRSSTNHNVPSPLAPSSTPPTPPNLRMPVSVAAIHSNLSVNTAGGYAKIPAYFDSNEDSNDLEKEVTEVFNETTSDNGPMPLGFVERIRALLDSNNPSTTSETSPTNTPGVSMLGAILIPDLPELPETPVGKCITREMILQALAPSCHTLESSSSIEQNTNLPGPELIQVQSVTPSFDVRPPIENCDRISIRSISQSVYSRPTNYTDPSEIAPRTVEEPPLPPLPSFDSGEPRKSELRKSMSLGSGMPGETMLRSFSTISAPHIPQSPTIVSAKTQTILERVKRRWSIRPTANPNTQPDNSATENSSNRGSSHKHPLSRHVPKGPDYETKRVTKSQVVQPITEKLKREMETRHIRTISAEIAEEFNTFARNSGSISPMSLEFDRDVHASSISPLRGIEDNLLPLPPPSNIKAPLGKPSGRMSRKQSTSVFNTAANYEGLLQETIPEKLKMERFNLSRTTYAPLPDVKEEPGLESKSDLRSTASTYTFPASRASGPRSAQESIRHSRADRSSKDAESIVMSTKTHSVFKHVSSGLTEAPAIPSLNFSCANLLSKLNEALGESALLGLALEFPWPQRPNSTAMREKYRSLFLSLEDMASNHEEFSEFASSHQLEIIEQLTDLDDLEDEDPQEVADHIRTFRPLSPDELIDEVNRLSVPSVGALTQRLSEIFPSLKRHFGEEAHYVEKQSDPLEYTINEIRGLGNINVGVMDIEDFPGWRVSMATARAAPLSAEFIVEPEIKTGKKRISKIVDRHHFSDPSSGRPFSNPPPDIAQLPCSHLIRGRMRSFSGSEVDTSILDRMNKLARPSCRSFRPPDGDTCPWNLASSYPWSNSIPFIDIKFPQIPSPHQRTPGPNLSVIGLLSVSEMEISDEIEVSSAAERGDIFEAEQAILVGPATGIASASPATTKHRAAKKHGLLGSLSRKILDPTPAAAVSPAPSLPPSPALLPLPFGPGPTKRSHTRTPSSARAHDSGGVVGNTDGYPATNLSLPSSVLNLDDVHSFFSDDSSATAGHCVRSTQNSRRRTRRRTRSSSPSKITCQPQGRPHEGSLRKRLTAGLRKKSHKTHTATTVESRRQVDSFGIDDTILLTATTSYPPHPAMLTARTAMTLNEIRAKRLVDRLKTLLWRGSELLRTVSGRRRHRKPGEDEGWSENGESFADLAVGALAEIGAPTVRGDSSRTTSLLTSPGVERS